MTVLLNTSGGGATGIVFASAEPRFNRRADGLCFNHQHVLTKNSRSKPCIG